MAEPIGFDRKIRRVWLDRAAEAALKGRDVRVVHRILVQALASEVPGSDARRKTANVLTRIWLRVPESHRALLDEAMRFWNDVDDDERLCLHWGLMLLAYPLFGDVAAAVGRLLRLQGSFTAGQVYRQIVARWGERSTLKYAVQRIVGSLADWGVIRALQGGRGPYTGAPPLPISRSEVALWLYEAALEACCGKAVRLYDLFCLPILFPFEARVGLDRLYASDRFIVFREGDGEEWIAVRAK